MEGNRVAITYASNVADGPQIVVGIQGADIMGVPRRLSRDFFVVVHRLPCNEHVLRGHSAYGGGHVFIPVLPVDACGIIHVLQKLVFVVRLHATVNRHGALLLVAPLSARHPDSRVQHSAYVQGPLSLGLLRLIVERVVCKKLPTCLSCLLSSCFFAYR